MSEGSHLLHEVFGALSVRHSPRTVQVHSYTQIVPPFVEQAPCRMLRQDGNDDDEPAESQEKAPQKVAADNGDSAAGHDDTDDNGSSNVWQPPVSLPYP